MQCITLEEIASDFILAVCSNFKLHMNGVRTCPLTHVKYIIEVGNGKNVDRVHSFEPDLRRKMTRSPGLRMIDLSDGSTDGR